MNREELLSKFGEPTKILDHGMIRLVDVMGDDGAIVQAARVSYGKGTKSVSEDRGLIRYLLRHRHTSPFEMCEIKLHCKMPIFVARQWIRHRTANVNELSGRYSIMPNEMHLPSPTVIAMQSASNKQGREEESVGQEEALKFLAMLNDTQELVRRRYEEFINEGYARELSRTVLPLSQYTEWYWKIDLRNLLHFLSLRLDAHAQYEIRVYADAIADIVKEWVPLTWEAFEDYILYAEQFSKQELQILRGVLRSADLLGVRKPEGMSDREVQAFIEKLS